MVVASLVTCVFSATRHEETSSAHSPAQLFAEFYAGRPFRDVGQVKAKLIDDGDTLKVYYEIEEPGLCFNETHLQIFDCSDLDVI
jgi:hypothetical protein